MVLLTPLAALVAVAALIPAAAFAFGKARIRSAQSALGLRAPRDPGVFGRPALSILAILLLALAATQPVLQHTEPARQRAGVAALFVVDTSRSMSASGGPGAHTRLRLATAAAVSLRSAIPAVPAGIATMTDRVLPSLLPVPGLAGFDGVARRAVDLDSPPPSQTSPVATDYGALGEIARGDYFAPGTRRRLVILLTDGESKPFDPAQVARALPTARGYHLITVRFWDADDAIYGAGGRVDPGYHPNPDGAASLNALAKATGGRWFTNAQLAGAASELPLLAGTGPSAPTGGTVLSQQPLAPFVAAAAGALIILSLLPLAWLSDVRIRALRTRSARGSGQNGAFHTPQM